MHMVQEARIVNVPSLDNNKGGVEFHIIATPGFPPGWVYHHVDETFRSADLPFPLTFDSSDAVTVLMMFNDFLRFVLQTYQPLLKKDGKGVRAIDVGVRSEEGQLRFRFKKVTELIISFNRNTLAMTIQPGPGMIVTVQEFIIGVQVFTRWMGILTRNPQIWIDTAGV